jgi:hypothetical protein
MINAHFQHLLPRSLFTPFDQLFDRGAQASLSSLDKE